MKTTESITPNAVADYLRTCAGMLQVQPCTVSLFGKTFPAAFYKQECEPLQGARSQEKYVRECIYVAGQRPTTMRKRDAKLCYTRTDDVREWYTAAHMDSDPGAQFAPFHPFGANFILAPWEVPGGEKIDHYEPKPYVRVPLEVSH